MSRLRTVSWIVCALLALSIAASTKKPWFGMALLLRAQADGNTFLYVARAPENEPAFESGIREGDLITALDGKRVVFRDLLDYLEYASKLVPGKFVRMRIARAGKTLELRVKVGELPAEYEPLVIESLRQAREARARARK